MKQDIQNLLYIHIEPHCHRVMADLIVKTSKGNDRREIFLWPPSEGPQKCISKEVEQKRRM